MSHITIQCILSLIHICIRDVDLAIQEAISLLNHPKRYIVASALVYLKLTSHFPFLKYSEFLEPVSYTHLDVYKRQIVFRQI